MGINISAHCVDLMGLGERIVIPRAKVVEQLHHSYCRSTLFTDLTSTFMKIESILQ